MEISVGLAFLLAFIAGFAYFTRRFMGELYLERAIVLGPLVGLIMGDLKTGLIMGATLELAFMGVTEIGGGANINMPIGTVLGTAFAISSGLSVEEALLIAIPASVIGSFFEILAKTFATFFVARAEKFAQTRNTKGFSTMVHTGNIFHGLAFFLPTFLALLLGQSGVESLAASIPAWLNAGVKVIGQVLPALGFALLLNTIATKVSMPWFFIGFILAAYLKFDVLGAAIVGVIIASLFVLRDGGFTLISKEETESHGSLVPPEYQTQIYWRSFALQSAFSFDRMQGLGFTWGLLPWLKHIYGDTPKLTEAILRHTTFFNTHPWVASPVYALVADMEARHAQGDESIDEAAIQGIKGSLMGPLAGIGDPLFHGTIRPVMAGIAASLAFTDNALGPVLFFVVMLILHIYTSKVTLDWGFKLGSTLSERLDPDSLSKLMEAVTTAGMVAIGALVGTWINITTPISYTSAEGVQVTVQSLLDKIFPRMLPLAVVLLLYHFARKGVSATKLMLIAVAAALVLGALKILG